MNLSYKITLDDYLVHQYYKTSKSVSARKKRRNNRLLWTVGYLLWGIILYMKDGSYFSLLLFGGLSIAWFFFYPLYEEWRLKKNFVSYIQENHEMNLDENVNLEFKESELIITNHYSKSSIRISEFKSLIELPDHYLLELVENQSVIIPKKAVQERQQFVEMLEERQITHVQELDWKWK